MLQDSHGSIRWRAAMSPSVHMCAEQSSYSATKPAISTVSVFSSLWQSLKSVHVIVLHVCFFGTPTQVTLFHVASLPCIAAAMTCCLHLCTYCNTRSSVHQLSS
ncbi:TPA: hypothetical protein ACH3X3_009589 [Trebouxia sp. C0006]